MCIIPQPYFYHEKGAFLPDFSLLADQIDQGVRIVPLPRISHL